MNTHVKKWVDEIAALTTPDRVVWCDGSEEERARLTEEAVKTGVLMPLNQEKMPGCYLHRSDSSDVARTEHLTFICSPKEEEAGPTNNWMSPADADKKVLPLFKGAMKGRTMYVVPFLMGPVGSKFSKVGVEITDSVYVVINMRIMTRMGQVALDHLGSGEEFTRCLHSLGDLSPDRRFICHFPQKNEIWSVGSGYGGNALLGKKCLALRIASTLGQRQGWLAEHMLILGVKTPAGKMHYVTGAFPSACGKTNLAMLVPPASMPGWEITTVGDDIAWLHPGDDGRLWAINPEAGFFGVAPGTSMKTNPNAMRTIRTNTIFTNVALKPDGTVWWEGHDDPPVEGMLDWQGKPWDPKSGDKAAHPNSRFTAPAAQCPCISPEFTNPNGVPISAILFGARRQRRVPLVFQAETWQHGTFLGATLASETTAAATGKVGVLRRDSMAMQPFCGYNMGDYLSHWLEVGQKLTKPPGIFRVNWFRTDPDGKFIWPGFGDNLRVLKWVLERCDGGGKAVKTAIGWVPTADAIDLDGAAIERKQVEELLEVDAADWHEALELQKEYFEKFGSHTPGGMWKEHNELAKRVAA
ncbi:MAG: phosphoenolpyruvate carboxykinase (GTP) [Deltaproteobacteria bacterium]|nr:phosphoenolpyruvate carboxykinase (GTP) [Deltaproteobacteria bacterium]